MLTFEEIILKLQQYWSTQGCLIGQPYGIETGAGTGNPHTTFRVLGPEPWNVCYVEPSRRPQDSRYGENPNRFGHYFQFQVILKPAPDNNIDLYIESLASLGLDMKKHDIRLVEDNWESLPLGAWGLGWEVWLDGMEVSQYTYFQQAGGVDLEVPALEITYGLERLAMYIQEVDHYKDLMWDRKVKYGQIFKKHEYYQSKYALETADIDLLNDLIDKYKKEALAQLKLKNYWVAYDYLLKISHTFNILDARKAVSLGLRNTIFQDMAKIAKSVAKLYLAERKKLKYPLLKDGSEKK